MHGSRHPHPDDPTRAAGADGPGREGGLLRYSVAHFLIALVVLLVTMPFVHALENGDRVEAVLMTLVLLSAVPAVGGRRHTLIAAVVLVTPALVGTWLNHVRPDLVPSEGTLVSALVFVAFVVVHLLRFILQSPRVDSQVLCAAISAYLMMATFWSFAHTLVARLIPGAYIFAAAADANRTMEGFAALYFSFSTLTTVAYGDIIPVANVARMLAMLEATTGLFYVTMLIARLVALYSSTEAARVASSATSPKESAT